MSFEVKEIHLISRTDNDPFTIKHTIPLGSSSDAQEKKYIQDNPLDRSWYDEPKGESVDVDRTTSVAQRNRNNVERKVDNENRNIDDEDAHVEEVNSTETKKVKLVKKNKAQ